MGNFSNIPDKNLQDSVNKNYVGVRLQQGVPLLDADWNLLEDLRRYDHELLAKLFVGDGVPVGSDGFRITPNGESDFIIKAGYIIVNGKLVYNPADVSYAAQNSTPLDDGKYYLSYTAYLDVWEEEVTGIKERRLQEETTTRIVRKWKVSVVQGANPVPQAPVGHTFYPLARAERSGRQFNFIDLRRTGLTVISKEITIKDGKVGIGTSTPVNKLDVEGSGVIGATYSGANAAPANGLLVEGNVGIGTSTPQNKVHVSAPGGFGPENADGTSQAGNVPLVLQGESTVLGFLNSSGRQVFALNVDGNEKTNDRRGALVFFDKYDGTWRSSLCLKTGRVGIGTTSPQTALHIPASGIQIGTSPNADDNFHWVSDTVGGGRGYRLYGGNYGSGNHRLTVSSNGNIGIGTTTPSTKLDVLGDLRINNSNMYLRGNNDNNHGLGWFGTGKLFAGANVDGPVLFGWSGGALGTMAGGQKAALSWNSNGNVGIGTTAPYGALQVYCDNNNNRPFVLQMVGTYDVHQMSNVPNNSLVFAGVFPDNYLHLYWKDGNGTIREGNIRFIN